MATRPTAHNPLEAAWEAVHQTRQWGQYPTEPLIRWVATTFATPQSRQNIPLLEVGCGAGANLWYLAEQGFSVTGLDFSRAALQRAQTLIDQRNTQAQLLYGTLTQLPVPTATQQVVIDMGATVCLKDEDLPAAFAEYYRVLAPGGHYYGFFAGQDTVKHPTPGTQATQYFNGSHTRPNVADIANRLFTQAEIITLATQAGFALQTTEQTLRSVQNQTQWVQLIWVHAVKPLQPTQEAA
jgi:ubiquinone/menaquinone biosynthesis C-methylase UbiE